MTNNTHTSAWLEPIQYPLANKFIREHGFRGRIRSDDECMVMRNKQNEIIAVAALRPINNEKLLTAVAVAPKFQGQGVVKQLLRDMSQSFSDQTYTFSLVHLVGLYERSGFVVVTEEQITPEMSSRLQAYRKQGRQITPMRYIPA